MPLALIVGISPFATDMYLPALPAIARDLDASSGSVQLSLTAFLVGLALGQLLLGSLSDGLGRRPFLLVGTAAFTVASVVCALAPSVEVLVVARVVQGLAGAAGVVAGRATVSDTQPATSAARTFSTMAALTAVGPAVAPLAGGAVLTVSIWLALFVVLAGLGLVLFGCALRWFPESHPPERRTGTGLRANTARMAELLRTRAFVGYVVTSCFATAGFFTYIAASPFVFQGELGVGEGRFTLVFAVNATCMIVSTTLFRQLVGRAPVRRLLGIGLAGCTVPSVVLLVLALTGSLTFVAAWVCLAVVTGGWGFVIPGTITLSQEAGRAYAGTAAALQGGLSFGVGGLTTPLSGLLGDTSVAMGSLMTGLLGAALVIHLVRSRRPVAGPHESGG